MWQFLSTVYQSNNGGLALFWSFIFVLLASVSIIHKLLDSISRWFFINKRYKK